MKSYPFLIFEIKSKEQLTLFWLTFPVYKIDDITILQHVRLLLHQFGHVDHRAISAETKKDDVHTSLFHLHNHKPTCVY